MTCSPGTNTPPSASRERRGSFSRSSSRRFPARPRRHWRCALVTMAGSLAFSSSVQATTIATAFDERQIQVATDGEIFLVSGPACIAIPASLPEHRSPYAAARCCPWRRPRECRRRVPARRSSGRQWQTTADGEAHHAAANHRHIISLIPHRPASHQTKRAAIWPPPLHRVDIRRGPPPLPVRVRAPRSRPGGA